MQKLIYCGRLAIYFVIRIFAQLLENVLYFLSTSLSLANTLKNSIQFNQAINEDRNLFIITNLLKVASISLLYLYLINAVNIKLTFLLEKCTVGYFYFILFFSRGVLVVK